MIEGSYVFENFIRELQIKIINLSFRCRNEEFLCLYRYYTLRINFTF